MLDPWTLFHVISREWKWLSADFLQGRIVLFTVGRYIHRYENGVPAPTYLLTHSHSSKRAAAQSSEGPDLVRAMTSVAAYSLASATLKSLFHGARIDAGQ